MEFRNGMLARRSSRGHCWHICLPLQSYLGLLGHETRLTEGLVSGQGHYWLTLPDKSIIDPTADQFATPDGSKMPKVYIGRRPRWYREFQIEKFIKGKERKQLNEHRLTI